MPDSAAAPALPRCNKCGCVLAKRKAGKVCVILGHRHFAITDAGEAEMICPECHQATTFPARLLRIPAKA